MIRITFIQRSKIGYEERRSTFVMHSFSNVSLHLSSSFSLVWRWNPFAHIPKLILPCFWGYRIVFVWNSIFILMMPENLLFLSNHLCFLTLFLFPQLREQRRSERITICWLIKKTSFRQGSLHVLEEVE
jgi:hypothetical protein